MKNKIQTKQKIINKGTGAGGANTVHNGSQFEELTNIEPLLLSKSFDTKILNKTKNGYYLTKNFTKDTKDTKDTENDSDPRCDDKKDDTNQKTITYSKQCGFKTYIKKEFNIDIYRHPDEAYVIKTKKDNVYHYNIKILEKKNQNGEGSVEDKLKTGAFNRKEYILMFEKMKDNITIDYAFTVSKFLEDKFESNKPKYNNIKKINNDDNIKIFYASKSNYFEEIYEWICN